MARTKTAFLASCKAAPKPNNDEMRLRLMNHKRSSALVDLYCDFAWDICKTIGENIGRDPLELLNMVAPNETQEDEIVEIENLEMNDETQETNDDDEIQLDDLSESEDFPIATEGNEDVTYEDFHKYETICAGGDYNMITEASNACKASGLDMGTYMQIIDEYPELKVKFNFDPTEFAKAVVKHVKSDVSGYYTPLGDVKEPNEDEYDVCEEYQFAIPSAWGISFDMVEQAVIDESEKGEPVETSENTFKLRAECEHDIERLLQKKMFQDSLIGEVVRNDDGVDDEYGLPPESELEFASRLSLHQLRGIIANIPDGHRMSQTLNYADKYDGETYYYGSESEVEDEGAERPDFTLAIDRIFAKVCKNKTFEGEIGIIREIVAELHEKIIQIGHVAFLEKIPGELGKYAKGQVEKNRQGSFKGLDIDIPDEEKCIINYILVELFRSADELADSNAIDMDCIDRAIDEDPDLCQLLSDPETKEKPAPKKKAPVKKAPKFKLANVYDDADEFVKKSGMAKKKLKWVKYETGGYIGKTNANVKKYVFSNKGFAVLKTEKAKLLNHLNALF